MKGSVQVQCTPHYSDIFAVVERLRDSDGDPKVRRALGHKAAGSNWERKRTLGWLLEYSNSLNT